MKPSDAELAGQLRLAVGRLGRQLRYQQIGGLTSSQLSALYIVEKHGPIRLSDLACHEHVSAAALSRCITTLESFTRRPAHMRDPRARSSRISASTAPVRDWTRRRSANRPAALLPCLARVTPTTDLARRYFSRIARQVPADHHTGSRGSRDKFPRITTQVPADRGHS